MKKNSFGKRFKYWFDKQMAKGTAVMIGLLAVLMLVVVLLLAFSIMVASGEYAGETVWTVLSTTINAWMPEADEDIFSTFIVSLAAVFGLFFTSFIIGIISSGVEDKLTALREGNSTVIENNHTVILGYKQAEYTLIRQLVLASGNSKTCIVVADDIERTDMEESIRSNVDFPRNVKLICRNIDISDPSALECCSIETSSKVIVQPFDDKKTIKVLLAVSTYMKDYPDSNVRIVTSLTDEKLMIPYYTRKKYGFTMLRTREIVARIIAHSCTQNGLSEAFMEVFDFAGNELYLEKLDEISGRKFKDVFYFASGGVPIGVYRNGTTYLNPDRNFELFETDELIVFEEHKGMISITDKNYLYESDEISTYIPEPIEKTKVLIIGSNNKLGMVVDELPENVESIALAGVRHIEDKHEMCKSIRDDISYELIERDVMDISVLEDITYDVSHVVLLSDYMFDEEDADLRNMMIIIKLRDIKERLHRDFTITAEMRREDSRMLIGNDDETDFIVSSNMSAMVLAQIAVTEKLYDSFHELLSNKGNEFELKDSDFISNCVDVSKNVAELRRELLHKGCILLGLIVSGNTILNPSIDMNVKLLASDKLIVISNM